MITEVYESGNTMLEGRKAENSGTSRARVSDRLTRLSTCCDLPVAKPLYAERAEVFRRSQILLILYLKVGGLGAVVAA